MRGAAFEQGAERGAQPAGESIPATEAQNNFGRVLGRAKREGRVFITRYDRPEAVVLSIEEYEALTGREPVDLQRLEREFDAMLLRMQRPEHGHAVDQLFAMTGSELGKAALGKAALGKAASGKAAPGSEQGRVRLKVKAATREQERAIRRR
jgi:prevent-host-death family protein